MKKIRSSSSQHRLANEITSNEVAKVPAQRAFETNDIGLNALVFSAIEAGPTPLLLRLSDFRG